jgi:hypothetical protein
MFNCIQELILLERKNKRIKIFNCLNMEFLENRAKLQVFISPKKINALTLKTNLNENS